MRVMKFDLERHPYPHFVRALLAFGTTSVDIARALGVTQSSAHSYLRGKALPRIEVVKRHPTLDAALTIDLAPQAEQSNRSLP
jgi:predicted transcriptional regulator